MIDSVVGHLARRGVHMGVKCMHRMKNNPYVAQHSTPSHLRPASNKDPLDNLLQRLNNPAAIATFVTTGVVFFVLVLYIEYAIRIVALNLTAVEDSAGGTGTIKLPLDADEPDASIAKTPLLDDVDDDSAVEHQAPTPAKLITSSLRSTFKHLRAVTGGRCAKLRGLRFAFFYALAFGFMSTLFTLAFSLFLGPAGMAAGRVLAAVVCCNAHATWTHATIAKPSSTPFFKRFLPRSVARGLIAPTIRLHVGLVFTQWATAGTWLLAVHCNRNGIKPLSAPLLVLPIVVFLFSTLAIVLPSHVALIRTEAALLPEGEECVVPLDKTFGGRLVARDAFPTGKAFVLHNLSIMGAWKTCGRPVYARVVKLLVKMVGILFVVSVFYVMVLLVELHLLAGKEVKTLLCALRKQAIRHG